MKNRIMIHKKSNSEKIILNYIIALIPLIIYGFYKNGIILFINNEIEFFEMFLPIIFPVLGLSIGILVTLIKSKKISINLNLLNGILVGMIIPINTSIWLFIISSFILLFEISNLENKININASCVVKLIIILIMFLFNNYSYQNKLELTPSYAFNFIDLLFGRQIGGVSTSSFIWVLVGFAFLATDYYYKKDIPVIAYISYVITLIISLLFTKDLSGTLNMIISATPLFCFVFIASISEYSPYTKQGILIYSISVGVISAILSFFVGLEASFIAVFILTLAKDLIDNFFRQKMSN